MLQLKIAAVLLAFTVGGLVELVWLGWALKRTLLEAPIWISALVVIANLMFAFGIATLADRQNRRAQSSEL